MGRLKKPINKAKFKLILYDYILPMIPVTGELVLKELRDDYYNYTSHALICFNEDRILFFSSDSPTSVLYCYSTHLTLNCRNKAAAEVVLASMLIDEQYYRNSYNFTIKAQARKKYQAFFDRNILDMTYEVGMLTWLMKRENAIRTYELIRKLKEWHEKTYEGGTVSFAILIDFDTEDTGEGSYIDFISKNESALFSDGLNSYVRVDQHMKFLEFVSDNYNGLVDDTYDFVPHNYEVLSKNSTGNKIGIVSTELSEMIIIKNRTLKFARIGGKWVYYNWNLINQAFKEYGIGNSKEEDSLRKSIYCSMLDTAFFHKGACIGIITKCYEEQVKSEIESVDNEKHDEIVEKSFVGEKFHRIERVLRKEMLSLDGATIMTQDGTIIYVGQIVPIKNLTKGGRRAGAKWLAQYGIGIKISEDGFTEVFGKNRNDKSNDAVELFRFG